MKPASNRPSRVFPRQALPTPNWFSTSSYIPPALTWWACGSINKSKSRIHHYGNSILRGRSAVVIAPSMTKTDVAHKHTVIVTKAGCQLFECQLKAVERACKPSPLPGAWETRGKHTKRCLARTGIFLLDASNVSVSVNRGDGTGTYAPRPQLQRPRSQHTCGASLHPIHASPGFAPTPRPSPETNARSWKRDPGTGNRNREEAVKAHIQDLQKSCEDRNKDRGTASC